MPNNSDQIEGDYTSFGDQSMPATYHRVAQSIFPLEPLADWQGEEVVQVDDQLQQFDLLAATGPSNWGVTLGLALGAQSHGALGAAVATASTLGIAIDVAEMYASVRAPFLRFDQSHQRGVTTIGVALSDAVSVRARQPVLEAGILGAASLLGSAGGGQVTTFVLNFEWSEPPWAHEYAAAGIKATFRQPANTLSIGGVRDTPNPLADKVLFNQAVGELQRRAAQSSMTSTIQSEILTLLDTVHGSYPTLSDAAALLNMSSRTLGRRLSTEHTTFRDVIDVHRRQRATVLLSAMSSTVSSVGKELGYSDTSNFVRAHRRWFGRSPRAS